MKKLFNGKKEANKKKAQEKINEYVHQDLRRVRPERKSFQERCGHCHGYKVMSNGKPCRNCGGSGTITRYS